MRIALASRVVQASVARKMQGAVRRSPKSQQVCRSPVPFVGVRFAGVLLCNQLRLRVSVKPRSRESEEVCATVM